MRSLTILILFFGLTRLYAAPLSNRPWAYVPFTDFSGSSLSESDVAAAHLRVTINPVGNDLGIEIFDHAFDPQSTPRQDRYVSVRVEIDHGIFGRSLVAEVDRNLSPNSELTTIDDLDVPFPWGKKVIVTYWLQLRPSVTRPTVSSAPISVRMSLPKLGN